MALLGTYSDSVVLSSNFIFLHRIRTNIMQFYESNFELQSRNV